jgi:hypothetical protein
MSSIAERAAESFFGDGDVRCQQQGLDGARQPWRPSTRTSAATPNGFGQEETIRAIWATDNEGVRPKR